VGEAVVWRSYHVTNMCAVVSGYWLRKFNVCSELLQVVGGRVFCGRRISLRGSVSEGFLFIK